MEVTNAGWINVGILQAELNIRSETEVDTQLKFQAKRAHVEVQVNNVLHIDVNTKIS